MVNTAMGKKRFAALAVGLALLATLVAALIALPAHAFYYVHGDHDVESDVKGAIEVFCTVDATATGGPTWSGLIFVPVESTADVALDEAVHASEDQNGVEANHNYATTSLSEFIAEEGGTWDVTIYHAESQKPGTHTTQDDTGETVAMTDLSSVTLQRFDQVVVTLQA